MRDAEDPKWAIAVGRVIDGSVKVFWWTVGIVVLVIVFDRPNVETKPEKLVPALMQATRCCQGTCQGYGRDVACGDVWQLQECLAGDERQCPVKGESTF